MGKDCFSLCGNLISANISSATTKIGNWFIYCIGLETVTISSPVKIIGSQSFYRCKNLYSINIPTSVTKIEHYCFSECLKLTTINIPSSVKSIGYRCFECCSSLRTINIPSGVTEIGDKCFCGCKNLTNIETEENGHYNREGNFLIKKDNQELIYFMDCKSYVKQNGKNEINIPTTVKILGNSCFSDCTELDRINIPTTVVHLKDHCFDSVKVLNITIPTSVTSIGNDCFLISKGKIEYNGLENTCKYIGHNSSLTFVQSMKTKKEMRLMVVGAGNVGKTCFIYKHMYNEFPLDFQPPVKELYITEHGMKVKLELLDSRGGDNYDRIIPFIYHNVDIFLLSFSLGDLKTLEEAEKKYLPEIQHNCPNCSFILMGTKSDLREETNFTYHAGVKKAKQLGAVKYVECSSLSGYNVNEIIRGTMDYILKNEDKIVKTDRFEKCTKKSEKECSVM